MNGQRRGAQVEQPERRVRSVGEHGVSDRNGGRDRWENTA